MTLYLLRKCHIREKTQFLPEKKKEFHKSVGIDSRVYGVQAAIDAGEVVVIALPYKEVAGAAREFADSLRKKIVVDTVVFDSSAEKSGIDFDWEILSLQIPIDQPPKQWMYFPALLLLGMVVYFQRRRSHLQS